MRLLAYCREDRIFFIPRRIIRFQHCSSNIWATRFIRRHSNPASGNACRHRHRVHAVSRMWHFLRNGLCFSRVYILSVGKYSYRYFPTVLRKILKRCKIRCYACNYIQNPFISNHHALFIPDGSNVAPVK